MSDRDDPGRVSSFCHDGGCVAVDFHGDADVEVYDTAEPGRRLAFTADEWSAFLAGVRGGEFDLTSPLSEEPPPVGGPKETTP